MKTMAKLMVLVLALALLVSATFGVSAAGDPAKLTSNGNTTEEVLDFTDASILKISTNGKVNPGAKLKAEVVDGGLQISAAADFAATYESVVHIAFASATDTESKVKLDWTGSIAADFTVDASKTTKTTQFLIGIMANKKGTNDGKWVEMRQGTKVYLQADGKTDWTAVTVSDKRTIDLPAGFKGVVRLSLDGEDLGPGPWRPNDHATDKNANDMVGMDLKDSLQKVTAVFFSYSGDSNPIVVSGLDVVKYGAPSGDDDKDTTTTTKKDTTTAAGATTGEAAPLAAAVALVLAVGTVAVCYKKR